MRHEHENPSMFALVYDRDGQEQARWPMKGDDLLDPDTYAQRFAALHGITLDGDKPGARIPDGCEHYRVTLQEEPGSVVCWTSRNYLIRA